MEDWNPSYDITQTDVSIGAIVPGERFIFDPPEEEKKRRLDYIQKSVVHRLNLDPDIVGGYLDRGHDGFQVFLEEGGEAVVNPSDGVGRLKIVKKRAFLFQINAMHLNSLKGIWTYIADIFACILLFMAASGVIMLPGKQGILGRGKWLVGIGLMIPVLAVIFS